MSEEAAAPAPSTANFRSVVASNVAASQAARPAPAAAPAAATREPVAARTERTERVEQVEAVETEPGTELEADATEQQTEQAEEIADLLDVDIHGRKGREILEAIRKGELPDELLAQLKRKAKVNGEDVEVTIEEALKGYQRNSDYSRGKRQAADEMRKAREIAQTVHDFIDGWKDGDTLLSGIKRLGKMDAFHKAAIKYAQELHADQELRTKNPEAYEARKALQAEREAREEAERRYQESQRKTVTDRDVEARTAEIHALTMPEFERLKIRDTPFARARFVEHFNSLWEEGAELADVVRSAAQATQEDLVDLASRFKKETDASAQPKPKLPPVGPTQSAPAPKGGFGGKKQISTGEFRDQLRGRLRGVGR
jgi:hypothetical protein